MLVVVAYEWLARRLGDQGSEITAHLLFYGLAGPLATYFTLRWITEGERTRLKAEQEMRRLYLQLSTQNERLGAVQTLMREVADAPDLEAVLQAAAQGAVRATGATHARLSLAGLELNSQVSGTARGSTLLESPSADLRELRVPLSTGPLHVGQGRQGEMKLYFDAPPTPETEELAQAIGAEVGSALASAQQRSRDLITLYEVDQSIRAERNMRRLLARVTGNMAERVGAQSRAAYLTDADGRLRLEYAREGDVDVKRGGTVPAFAERVAQAGVPLIASPQEAAGVLHGSQSALGLPMRGEDGLVGVIVLGSAREGAFTGMRVPLLALLASQATLAVRNARAYLHSEEVAIGEERSRIAREIHDGVAQSLAVCAIRLDIVERQILSDPEKAIEGVRAAASLLREQIREVRRSIFALRPIDLERYGLLETVRRYVQDFGEQNNLKARLSIEGDVTLAPGDEAVMFRILQESLNNVAKHARASSVDVTVQGGSRVKLCIQDDGQGFDPQQVSGRVSSAGGLGLIQMKERVESRGGSYKVSSAPHQGTRIEAQLPQG
ncbi:GAF domain-containing sensor histidine kinase [Deinococcus sp. KNUC1210]|uniref:GAF domain-containing sensor histidine kinase n=1 Tax=Deinococcus sp. KNUC1210 TaxID=2917691 RepID=UPI001EF0DF7C|nr:GAF domain-containing sensor histidine kinase [Deinococcus sp. KNUC1210]ULH16939.1 GAF domain-containing sensor histidine kinase [Deinococcus sp. KNUC1210]